MLAPHQRLSCIKPLVQLCRESAATNLQQFEALLALTNVLSCGSAEHDKLAAEKGVHAVHYLIFSEHLMVRCAATEALCNMSSSPHLLHVSTACVLAYFFKRQ
jgi:protein unc-45